MIDIREPREKKPLPKCLIREATRSDNGFIYGNYLKAAHSAYAYRNMAEPAFKNYGARLLETLLERSQAVVVCNKEQPDELVGFAITERPFKSIDQIVLHFAYVKYDYRAQGLCTAMVKALGHEPPRTQLFATHITVAWFHIGAKYGAVYNPFYLFPQFHTEKEKA